MAGEQPADELSTLEFILALWKHPFYSYNKSEGKFEVPESWRLKRSFWLDLLGVQAQFKVEFEDVLVPLLRCLRVLILPNWENLELNMETSYDQFLEQLSRLDEPTSVMVSSLHGMTSIRFTFRVFYL